MTSSSLLNMDPSHTISLVLGIVFLVWFSSSTLCLRLGTLFLLYGSFPVLRKLAQSLPQLVSKTSLSSFSSGSDLSPTEFRPFKLIKKIPISHNTAIYRFALRPTQSLGLPLGQHVSVKMVVGDKEYQRSYTPITVSTQVGFFELLVKTYVHGTVSKKLSDLAVGQTVLVKGPKGQFKYTPNTYSVLNMVAGGTGITPMYQLIQAILRAPHEAEKEDPQQQQQQQQQQRVVGTVSRDTTKLRLVFANVTVEDILLKKEIDDLAAAHPEQFKVYYVLNQPPENWQGGTGFVTKEVLQTHLEPPTSLSVKLLLCGPPPMMKAMTTYAEELGYEKAQTISKMTDQIFKF